MEPREILNNALLRLTAYGLEPRVGAELECYVAFPSPEPASWDAFFSPIIALAESQSMAGLRVEAERGPGQFELVLPVFSDPSTCAASLHLLRREVEAAALRESLQVSFAGKPFSDAPGSGLHVHISLLHGGEGAFHKTDDYMSDVLRYALGGLCGITPYVMALVCPDEQSFHRYSDKDHMARTVSWGSNNRSCAVRIPYTQAWEDKRLEWRIPSANAEPFVVLSLLLHAVACGIDARIEPPVQSYGIASREAGAQLLPQTYAAAHDAIEGLPAEFAPLSADLLRRWIS